MGRDETANQLPNLPHIHVYDFYGLNNSFDMIEFSVSPLLYKLMKNIIPVSAINNVGISANLSICDINYKMVAQSISLGYSLFHNETYGLYFNTTKETDNTTIQGLPHGAHHFLFTIRSFLFTSDGTYIGRDSYVDVPVIVS